MYPAFTALTLGIIGLAAFGSPVSSRGARSTAAKSSGASPASSDRKEMEEEGQGGNEERRAEEEGRSVREVYGGGEEEGRSVREVYEALAMRPTQESKSLQQASSDACFSRLQRSLFLTLASLSSPPPGRPRAAELVLHDLRWLPTQENRALQQAAEKVTRLSLDLIARRRQEQAVRVGVGLFDKGRGRRKSRRGERVTANSSGGSDAAVSRPDCEAETGASGGSLVVPHSPLQLFPIPPFPSFPLPLFPPSPLPPFSPHPFPSSPHPLFFPSPPLPLLLPSSHTPSPIPPIPSSSLLRPFPSSPFSPHPFSHSPQGDSRKDLLAVMLAARDDVSNEQMTDQQLVDECVTFLLAGTVRCCAVQCGAGRCYEVLCGAGGWVGAAVRPRDDSQAAHMGCVPASPLPRLAEASEGGGCDMFHPFPTHPTISGHETTAKLLTWAVYLLARYPDWQKRASGAGERDAHGATGRLSKGKGGGRKVTWEQVGQLSEMHMHVSLGPYWLPAGTRITMAIGMAQSDPRFWGEDALEFNPARFKGEIQPIKPQRWAGEEAQRLIRVGFRDGQDSHTMAQRYPRFCGEDAFGYPTALPLHLPPKMGYKEHAHSVLPEKQFLTL
ncbi:unnamed protein product [Closterium sp. Naga37s-1]|nr:unnamed protein product [Closterium sp. Naga37s-1]